VLDTFRTEMSLNYMGTEARDRQGAQDRKVVKLSNPLARRKLGLRGSTECLGYLGNTLRQA